MSGMDRAHVTGALPFTRSGRAPCPRASKILKIADQRRDGNPLSEHLKAPGGLRTVSPGLGVFIPRDVCPFGVLLGRTLDRDRRAGLETRVEELGHRLADLLAQGRLVPTEVLDVPLVKNEPLPEGDARACPGGEVPAQHAELTVRIAAPGAWPFQMPPAIRIHPPLDPRLVRQQPHVHRLAGGTARLGVMNPD